MGQESGAAVVGQFEMVASMSGRLCRMLHLSEFRAYLQEPNPRAGLKMSPGWLPARHRIGGGSKSSTRLNSYFFVARRLVAAALLARDPAAVVPFNRGGLHAAALSWADGDTTWADANCGVGIVPPATGPIVAVVAVPPDLNIDALGNLDALGLGRSDERGSRQHRCDCRHGKSDLHVGVLGLPFRCVAGRKALSGIRLTGGFSGVLGI